MSVAKLFAAANELGSFMSRTTERILKSYLGSFSLLDGTLA